MKCLCVLFRKIILNVVVRCGNVGCEWLNIIMTRLLIKFSNTAFWGEKNYLKISQLWLNSFRVVGWCCVVMPIEKRDWVKFKNNYENFEILTFFDQILKKFNRVQIFLKLEIFTKFKFWLKWNKKFMRLFVLQLLIYPHIHTQYNFLRPKINFLSKHKKITKT